MSGNGLRSLVLIGLLLLFGAAPGNGEPPRPGTQNTERQFLIDLLAALTSETVGPETRIAAPYPPSPQTVVSPGFYSLTISDDFKLGGVVFKDGRPFLHNDGGYSSGNTALGLDALVSATPGVPYPGPGEKNTAIGFGAMRNTSSGHTNTAVGFEAMYANTTGFNNLAVGNQALIDNVGGSRNLAVGNRALYLNTGGSGNIAIGLKAMYLNKTSNANIAIGEEALRATIAGYDNVAAGHKALHSNQTGDANIAIGALALENATGSRNIGIGWKAGYNHTTGSDNIFIGTKGGGGSPDSNTLRIGLRTGTGADELNRVFIQGIHSANLVDEPAVCVDDVSGQLGLCNTSSARFKEDIEAMGEASEGIFDLRPVRFHFRKEYAGEDDGGVHYGLIAEEVAEKFPGLVTYDKDGRPLTVQYSALTSLLLNELKKQQQLIAGQAVTLGELQARLARLEALDARVP